MTTSHRLQSHHRGYTIIESLVVLVVLSILSLVAVALFLHAKNSTLKDNPALPVGNVPAPAAHEDSAPPEPAPVEDGQD